MTILTQDHKDALMNRLNLIKTNLRHCRGNGCDIHEVAQMEMMAECIAGLLRRDLNADLIEAQVHKLHNKHLEYFKRKFSH